MNEFLDFGNKAQGRDKLFRVTQYACKFLGWHFSQQGKDENLINALTQLEKNVSTSRKLFRFGRSIDSLKAAQRAVNLQDYLVRLTMTASHTNKAFYLLVDHYVWLARVGVVAADLKKWSATASRFYLASLVFAFVRDLYALHITMERCLQNTKHEDVSDQYKVAAYAALFYKVVKRNPQAAVDLVKNACDIVIPAASLGYLNVNNGVVGVCGVISSLLGALQIASPSMKLKP